MTGQDVTRSQDDRPGEASLLVVDAPEAADAVASVSAEGGDGPEQSADAVAVVDARGQQMAAASVPSTPAQDRAPSRGFVATVFEGQVPDGDHLPAADELSDEEWARIQALLGGEGPGTAADVEGLSASAACRLVIGLARRGATAASDRVAELLAAGSGVTEVLALLLRLAREVGRVSAMHDAVVLASRERLEGAQARGPRLAELPGVPARIAGLAAARLGAESVVDAAAGAQSRAAGETDEAARLDLAAAMVSGSELLLLASDGASRLARRLLDAGSSLAGLEDVELARVEPGLVEAAERCEAMLHEACSESAAAGVARLREHAASLSSGRLARVSGRDVRLAAELYLGVKRAPSRVRVSSPMLRAPARRLAVLAGSVGHLCRQVSRRGGASGPSEQDRGRLARAASLLYAWASVVRRLDGDLASGRTGAAFELDRAAGLHLLDLLELGVHDELRGLFENAERSAVPAASAAAVYAETMPSGPSAPVG